MTTRIHALRGKNEWIGKKKLLTAPDPHARLGRRGVAPSGT
jgi:hypothetical protein